MVRSCNCSGNVSYTCREHFEISRGKGHEPSRKFASLPKAYKSKKRKYTALISVVNRLMEERKLKFQPQFLFPVVSSLGYMNEDMNQLIEFMEKCFKANQSKERRFDGLLPKILKGRFKVELRNTLCFALVRGNALAINNQGFHGVTHPC